MAKETYSQTNQKLYFVKLALQRLRQAQQSDALQQSALLEASRQEALFHLYGALLSLCQEITEFYAWPEPVQGPLRTLLQPQRLAQYPGPELGELVELNQHPDSWLARLLNAHEALFVAPLKTPRQSIERIQAVDLLVTQAEDDILAELQQWRQNVQALAVRFRQAMTEL